MTPREMELLKLELLRTTPLSRLNHSETDVVFERLGELGYVIEKKPADANK